MAMGRPMLPLDTRTCGECGQSFQCKRHKATRYCSTSCSGKVNHRKRKRGMCGPDNPRYNGGFSKSPEGRTIVCTRDGRYTFWYRVVMEDAIGRPLTSEEIVHHINGDWTDDRLENLELTNRADHMAHHRPELEAGRGIA